MKINYQCMHRLVNVQNYDLLGKTAMVPVVGTTLTGSIMACVSKWWLDGLLADLQVLMQCIFLMWYEWWYQADSWADSLLDMTIWCIWHIYEFSPQQTLAFLVTFVAVGSESKTLHQGEPKIFYWSKCQFWLVSIWNISYLFAWLRLVYVRLQTLLLNMDHEHNRLHDIDLAKSSAEIVIWTNLCLINYIYFVSWFCSHLVYYLCKSAAAVAKQE